MLLNEGVRVQLLKQVSFHSRGSTGSILEVVELNGLAFYVVRMDETCTSKMLSPATKRHDIKCDVYAPIDAVEEIPIERG